MMKRIHIVGRKNHGKTTLMVDLVKELTRRGLRVGTIKHSRHAHELDTPGKDSHRHRLAGGSPVSVVTAETIGLYVPRVPDAELYDLLAPAYNDCDLVLAEGHIDAPGVKIEVWRATIGGPSLASERTDLAAVVSDEHPDVDVPVWPRTDVAGLADRLLQLAGAASE